MAVTYQQLYDRAVNWMTTNCKNVADYTNSVPAELKSGYSKYITCRGTISGNMNRHATARAKFTISNDNCVKSYSSIDLTSNFTKCLNNYGITSFGSDITRIGLISFMNALSAFSSSCIRITASQFCGPIVVYMPQYVSSSYTTYSSSDLIVASDISTITTNILTILNNSTKPYPIRYVVTYDTVS